MASSMMISVLIVKIFLAFKCELSSAHAPTVNVDHNSNAGSLLFQIIDGLFDEMENKNKEMTEKIDKLEEKNDSGLETLQANLEALEEKNDAGLEALQADLEALEEKNDAGLEALQTELKTIKDEISELCPPPYTYNARLKLCWRLATEKTLSWTYARFQCASEGGDLIVLDTPEKISYIKTALAGMSASTNLIWVGGDDQSVEGKFKWVNGAPVQGIPWGGGEPNNIGGNQDCMGMYKPDGKFWDQYCTYTYSFMCELN